MVISLSEENLNAIRRCISITLNDLNFDDSDFDYRLGSTRDEIEKIYKHFEHTNDGSRIYINLKNNYWYSVILCLSNICGTVDWEDHEFLKNVGQERKNVEIIIENIERRIDE